MSTYAMGGLYYTYDGGGGQILSFLCVRTNYMTPLLPVSSTRCNTP